jgi:hypothetical protein
MPHKSYHNPYTPQNREFPYDVEEAADLANVEEGRDTQENIIEKMVEQEQRHEHQHEDAEFESDLHSANAGVTQAATTGDSSETAHPKSEFLIQIENILSDGLGDIYKKMEPTAQFTFKQKGEEVSYKIENMLARGKARAKEILHLIKEWLKKIPGVNRFFLEQEAKIKTDRILGMSLDKY